MEKGVAALLGEVGRHLYPDVDDGHAVSLHVEEVVELDLESLEGKVSLRAPAGDVEGDGGPEPAKSSTGVGPRSCPPIFSGTSARTRWPRALKLEATPPSCLTVIVGIGMFLAMR